jgi:hypothetical protein
MRSYRSLIPLVHSNETTDEFECWNYLDYKKHCILTIVRESESFYTVYSKYLTVDPAWFDSFEEVILFAERRLKQAGYLIDNKLKVLL